MTAFEPTLKLYVGDVQTGVFTQVTGIIDYNFSVNAGSNDYINPPNPGNCSITLLFDDTTVPPIAIGQYLYIYDSSNTWTIFRGRVTTRSAEYRNWGTAGYLMAWTFEFVGAISDLQKMTWYNPSVYTGTTTQCIDLIRTTGGRSTWEQANPSLTWENAGEYSWASWDGYTPDLYIHGDYTNVQSQTLAAGYRNVWDDLVTLTYGVWGFIQERSGSEVLITTVAPPVNQTINQNQLMVDLVATDSTPNMRNDVTITKYDTTSIDYRDQQSVYQYGSQPGTLATYINNDSDALTTAAKIINGLAYPSFGLDRASVNGYNPNVSGANLKTWANSTGSAWTVDAPNPFSNGTNEFIPVGYAISASKNAWIFDYYLVPLSVAVNSINWEQVPPSYTWTSYGTAYPTQKWSDL